MKKHLKLSNAFLCVMSLYFYAYGEPKFVFLMIASIIFNYCIALLIDRASRHRNVYLIVSVVFNIGILFVCKYLGWSIEILNSIFAKEIPAFTMALPIGISFYTFQAMSYVIDVWKKVVPAQKNIINVGLYVSLFPQLVAGPIVRYTDIEKQIYKRSLSPEKWGGGIERFIIGFSKKVLLADSFSVIADKAFLLNSENTMGFLFAWIGAIAYSLQIYYDFSGYSDMAIGLGKMLGFTFLENFNYPYMASSITDFWRRWHISLSSWFRDYVYIPLGGNRVSILKFIRNIFVVWFLTGFWHGASWNFIIWGLYFGVILLIEKFFLKKYLDKTKVLKYIYTSFIVVIGFLIFNSISLNEIFNSLGNMFFINDIPLYNNEVLYYLKSNLILIIVALIGCSPLMKNIYLMLKKTKYKNFVESLEIVYVMGLLVLCTAFLIDASFNPFLYFRF